jgi:hypothetical protein
MDLSLFGQVIDSEFDSKPSIRTSDPIYYRTVSLPYSCTILSPSFLSILLLLQNVCPRSCERIPLLVLNDLS